MGGKYNKIGIVAMAGLAALAGALVVAAASLLVWKSDDNSPIEIKIPAPLASPAPASSTDQPSTVPGSTGAPIQVYVSGAVRRPGVYELRSGDRLDDALAAAGGVVEDADLESINLAGKVRDEGYYHVSRLGETPRPEVVSAADPAASSKELALSPDSDPSAGGGAESQPPLVDLNSATTDLLDSLPGIGPVRAQAIVDFRERNGPFASVEDIINVQGIADGTYEQIRGLVIAGPPQ